MVICENRRRKEDKKVNEINNYNNDNNNNSIYINVYFIYSVQETDITI